MIGRCPYCRSEVTPKTLISINGAKIPEMISNESGELKMPPPIGIVSARKASKIDILLDIIKQQYNQSNYTNTTQSNIQVSFPELQSGNTEQKTLDAKSPIKALVFASYDDALNKYEEIMHSCGINFERLAGTVDQIANIVTRFHRSDNTSVLFVNSVKKCASLNLQCCSDIIFMHNMYEKDLMAQAIGRGQRYGRTSKLRVHFILHNNENYHF
jgi:hypothetical protein